MLDRLEKATGKATGIQVEKQYDSNIWLDSEASNRKVLLRMEPTDILMGESYLQTPPLFIGNTDHIGVVGDNGCGKTTLIKEIISSIFDDVRMLYIPQEPTELQKTETLRKSKGYQIPNAEECYLLWRSSTQILIVFLQVSLLAQVK